MNHKHRQTLHALFAHPVSSNIDPHHAFSMIEALGAEVTRGGHGRLMVSLNGQSHGFHDSQHSLSKDDVSVMRKFLEAAGVDPQRDYPL